MTDLFNTSAAADYLHAVFADKPASYWYQRLINARRTDRPHQTNRAVDASDDPEQTYRDDELR